MEDKLLCDNAGIVEFCKECPHGHQHEPSMYCDIESCDETEHICKCQPVEESHH